jgi:hypothetical protein
VIREVLGQVIDEIEAVLAPYFLGLVWFALWWKVG